MSHSINDTSAFSLLFKGNDLAYGVTKVGAIVDGKAQSESRLVYGQPASTVWEDHLDGRLGIGIAPIREDSTCFFGAIDIDSYGYDMLSIVRAIYDFDIPLVPCYSKSHKLHLYAFFAEAVDADKVIAYLKKYVAAFGCDPKTEIFPKQKTTSDRNKFYSWINMPYFDENNPECWRKAIGRDGTPLSLADGLELMFSKRILLSEHQGWWEEGYRYADAPPCVLSGLLLRDVGPGSRNNWLFNVGVYLQLKDPDGDLASQLYEINKSLDDPIDDSELQATVIKGFQRKTYYYNCAAMGRCSKAVCRQQEWGIESKASTGLDYGQLTQYMTDPPYYEWVVNGQKLNFWSETEILGQRKFRALCLRQLHLVPRQVSDEQWSRILTKAAENVVVVDSTETGDFTSGSVFVELVSSFFHDKRRATNITQVALGRIFEEEDEYVFMARPLMDFITQKNDFKVFTPAEIRSRMTDLGAYKDGSYWRIPKENISKDAVPEIDVDFKPKENIDEAF